MERGMFFPKKKYSDVEQPVFEKVKKQLPQPVLQAHPEWIDCYWYALKILFGNTHKPSEESGYVSNFVDAAFNADIFLWDTCFMTLFCNLLHPYIPGIRSLDNFYCKQFDDGEIPRELVRDTGEDFPLWVNQFDKPLYSYFHNHYGYRGLSKMKPLPYEELYKPDLGRTVEKHPYLTLDNLNHPILAMAEWQSYCHTKDVARLHLVWESLYQYYCAFRYHLRHVNGMYVTDWASMDNSPRNKYLGFGVDTTCEMVLFAGNLLDILDVLEANGYQEKDAQERRTFLEKDKAETIQIINQNMWNKDKGFYFDVTKDGEQCPVKTAAAFWALISKTADKEQQRCLVQWLEDEHTFKRIHRVPVLAADEPGYDPNGGYWSGSVWAPTNAMIVLGLEKCGYPKVARDIAMNHLDVINRVYQKTGTIWENYPADSISSGDADHADMVGWSGIAPILYLIQYAIGLHIPEGKDYLEWNLNREMLENGKVGCLQYWFAGKTADFEAVKEDHTVKISVRTNDTFKMQIQVEDHVLNVGIQGDTELCLEV